VIVLLIIAAVSFAASLTVLADTALPAARRRRGAVAIVGRYVGSTRRNRRAGRRQVVAFRALEPIGTRLASRKFREALSERIAAAGLAGRVTPEAFLAFRTGIAALGVLAAVATGEIANLGARTLFFGIALGAAGFLAPGYMLLRKARVRRGQISRELPDALDLLAVTVEAGVGLFGAIERLVSTTTGPLADEFALVLTELRVGDSSERALKRMASRLHSQEIASFVRSLIQGEQLGLSLAQTLRNLADDARHKRRAIAEELAAKSPVKMLLPTALFIFPALFVVILGPAVLELGKYL